MSRRIIGLAGAVTAGTLLTVSSLAGGGLFAAATAPTQSTQINRTLKTDAMQQSAAVQQPRRVAVVEVVGVDDTAIIYRDRDGNVLFETNPVSNVTVITKNVVLPQVTVRETADADVQKMPIEQTRPILSPTRPSEGCEAAIAPHTEPGLQRAAARCLSKIPDSIVLSAN
ncbi:MAG: hypothetical protein KF794_01000 [Xanthobacteraceae bacterium]|nr:hypothetical protein [Xanthobacteraceae bacterium]QYK45328.1 MAG: hypothetical protein KF794_01000 [Xanthobacteraceae bacterium]